MSLSSIISSRRGSFSANYSVDLPHGLLTNVLHEFCKSKWSLLNSNELAGQAGIPIHQDDLDKCMGVINSLVDQKVNYARAQKEMLEKQILMLKNELSQPVVFDEETVAELSFTDGVKRFKEKIVSLKERRPS